MQPPIFFDAYFGEGSLSSFYRYLPCTRTAVKERDDDSGYRIPTWSLYELEGYVPLFSKDGRDERFFVFVDEEYISINLGFQFGGEDGEPDHLFAVETETVQLYSDTDIEKASEADAPGFGRIAIPGTVTDEAWRDRVGATILDLYRFVQANREYFQNRLYE